VEHGEEALAEARRSGFRCSGVIHRSLEDVFQISHNGYGPRERSAFAFGSLAIAGIVGLAANLGLWVITVSMMLAFLAVWYGTLWMGLGMRIRVLRSYRGFVLPGESLVVVQAKEAEAPEVIAALRRIGQASVFAIRPGPGLSAEKDGEGQRRKPFTTASLPDCATELATTHSCETSTRSSSLLPILRDCELCIERARADLAEAVRLEYGITHEAEWLLDNAYLIRSNIADIRHNLPDNHNRILPVLKDRRCSVRIRVYHLAAELIDGTGHRLGAESIISFLNAYQRESPLTIAELWVFPLMLRLVLLERLRRLSTLASLRQHEKELADFWADRFLNAAQRPPELFSEMLSELDRRGYQLTPHFIERLGEQLHQEESTLAPIQHWIQDKTGQRLVDIIRSEQAEEANDLMLIAAAVGSLRQLSELQYPKLVETVSRMESILRQDPAGIHASSDFATRDRARRQVEASARHSKKSESEVAQLAIELAQTGAAGSRENCVSYYLLDEGLSQLEMRLGCRIPLRERWQRFLLRHPTFVYLAGLATITVALSASFGYAAYSAGLESRFLLLLLGGLALFPSSEVATYLLHMALAKMLPPRVLPKMSFEEGIPDECRTLVVVPMMLLTPESISGEIEKLEVRYFANPGANVWFSLLSDYTDAAEREMPEDDNLLGLAMKGIEQLNSRHSGGRFLLFHRTRDWCATEERWIGWERKRGKLEELNSLLNGGQHPDFLRIGSLPEGIRYAITLDADTMLPHDTALKLIETISHPLNRVELKPDKRNRARGYTIIQPRVSITLPSATATRFTRLFTDARGTDPYSQAVSDVYQDLFGEAIYHGKAIYDVRAFHEILNKRFPEQRLLSHDLIEGSYVGVGLASDIELFEQFPNDYTSYGKRQHRWIRGDWQIASWIFGRVPASAIGTFEPNPLSIINRWKIFDNLRRSLVAVASLLLLATSWTFNVVPTVASALVALSLVLPLFFQILDRMVARWRGDSQSWREANSDLNLAVVKVAFLPHQSYLTLDAIARVFYRLRVSQLHLLEWQTAEASQEVSRLHLDPFRAHFFLISAITAVFMLWLEILGILWRPQWAPFLVLWLLAPMLQHWIRLQRRSLRKAEVIGINDQLFLRRIARQTWRYFDDLVTREQNWLPPDNSQEALRVEVAERTSPTNIGLWLVSALSARDFGFLTLEPMVERCTGTMETLARLETCEGHLLNWYNTRTLAPLLPKYVSTVDSGNLIASLWVFGQACRELDSEAQLDARALRGLSDTLAVITERLQPDHSTEVLIAVLRSLLAQDCTGIEILRRMRLAVEPMRELADSLRWSVSPTGERSYWFTQLQSQLQSWISHADRYLRWLDVLAAPPDEFLLPLGAGVVDERRILLRKLPSWGTVARGEIDFLNTLSSDLPDKDGQSKNLIAWVTELKGEYALACVAAGELLGRIQNLGQRSEALADRMDMQFLYDSQRRLFAIGYQVGGPRNITSHYDLLASEARLASLVAIAKGDIPAEHWIALGRPYTSLNGQVLLSWSGTMFEYLMPLLFTRSFRNSLLENGCIEAVKRQIQYTRDKGVPWGISESAYSAIDSNKIYQYRAFGVPSLGLKRGLEEDLVVAPYATALALLVDPAAAIQNLKRLTKLGMYGLMGFYESLDYSRQDERQGSKGVIVYAYMSHHQGMSLVAFNNVLNRGIMQNRFHADRRIKAVEPLLFERIPPVPSMLVHRPPDHVPTLLATEPSAPEYRVFDEDTPIPRVQLMGNGRYAMMITNTGAGYSRWGEFDITRWRSDTTRDHWGNFLYLREPDTNTLWSLTHQPLNAKDPRYTATFSADRVEFRRRKIGIESQMEVTVSTEDDVEIRRITLTNQGVRARTLELTSAAELSLAPHGADRAHPAFSKLFVETEAQPDLQALIAWRRPRSSSEPPIWVAQMMVNGQEGKTTFEYETDRAKFLGRGRTWLNPAMNLSQTDGFVLDPVFAIRQKLQVQPRQQVQISLLTIAASSREELMRLVLKYRDLDVCSRAFELAWSHAQLEFRYLGIQSDAAMRFAELASHMLYPNLRLRAPAERLRRNELTQSRLWAHGISGDMPIAVVWVDDSQGLSFVRELLAAHTYWHLHGFKTDLIILNREPASYEQPLHQQLLRLAEAHSLHTGMHSPGGVFLFKADQLPEADVNLILCTAQVAMSASRGTLAKQLSSPPEGFPLPPQLLVKRGEELPSTPLPFLQLPYFNGFGGFTADGREYAIYLGPSALTPLPWINVMANSVFGTMVSESGSGCCWYGNSQSNRLTPWANDPVSDPAGEAIFIRDEVTGVCWTPTPLPVRELDAYRARHGQGYTEIEHNSHGLEQTLMTFVPLQTDRADPLRIQRLRIRNRSTQRRRLSVTTYSEFVLGSDREATQMHVTCTWDNVSKSLLVRNPYHSDYGGRIAFASLTPDATSYSSDRTVFLGRNGTIAAPAALRRDSLANRTGPGLDPCGALQTKFELAPGEETTVVYLLGQADDTSHARQLIADFRNPESVERSLESTRNWWDHMLTTIQVKTPVLSVDLMMNRWLLYQSLSCRVWGRSALYQSSGAFGFRDQLQDALALLYAAAPVARDLILRAASRQFHEGDVQHWWHIPSGAGVRTRCSDDLLWLPYAVCQYVDVTGDAGVLDAETPFLNAPVLSETEHEIYGQPTVSIDQASIFEHCRRAIEKGITAGPHGLPLIGTCDWNDSLSSVGIEGKGESVWLAWFLIDVLKKFSKLCTKRGEFELSARYSQIATRLTATVEETCWDGEWYLRAFFDDGSPLGSHNNSEARIDSLAQSWAVISGAGNPERAALAMQAVEKYLIHDKDKLVLLFTPPFDKSKPNPGYIMGYPPGVRENGGQYTHAALWVAMAFARMKDGDRAVRVLQLLNPIEHSRTPEDCATYLTEPYAVAADVYSLEGQTGRGGWTWYTGSAGWMYRVWLEEVLGFKLKADKLSIEPAIPSDWPGYEITFRFGRSEYRIEVTNGGEGTTREFHLVDDGQTHVIQVQTGSARVEGSAVEAITLSAS